MATQSHRRPALARRRYTLTDRDLELTAWIARQRIVLAAQAQAWLGVGRVVAYRRLQALVSLGLLRHERIFHAQPGVFYATAGGLALCDSPLPPARVDLRSYRHDLGVVWVSLALAGDSAQLGGQVVTEREMRSADGRAADGAPGALFAIALAGTERRLHYPDLALVDGAGRRAVAVELELTAKGARRLERILAGYARDRALERVIYYTDRAAVRAALERAAARAGAGEILELHDFDEPALRKGLLAGTTQQIDKEVDQ